LTTPAPGGIAGTGIAVLTQLSMASKSRDAPPPPPETAAAFKKKVLGELGEQSVEEAMAEAKKKMQLLMLPSRLMQQR